MDVFGSEGYHLSTRPQATPSPSSYNLDGARVLLAEDNEINQQVAQEILTDAGVVVSIAGDGQEALEMLEQGRLSGRCSWISRCRAWMATRSSRPFVCTSIWLTFR